MTPELKAKWIAALRSGKYQQCRASIRDQDRSYCCLGVLAVETGWKPEHGTDGYHHIHARFIDPDVEMNALIDLNDVERKNFAEIADWIEANIAAENEASRQGDGK